MPSGIGFLDGNYRTVIALGSNLGDSKYYLNQAVIRLAELGKITAISPVYRTAPVSSVPQDDYLNAVLILDTLSSPELLLVKTLEIEAELGRERIIYHGPRTIDIDLISVSTLRNGKIIEITSDSDFLQLPHPRAVDRGFVLVPWLAIEPMAKLGGTYIKDLSAAQPSLADVTPTDFVLSLK